MRREEWIHVHRGGRMTFVSPEFLSALAAIIVIDIALAGDNAIVIALAARNLPAQLRRRAIVWGTAGAVAVRATLTAGVVWLLAIPGLMAAGGAVLVWIAYKLLRQDDASHHVKPANGFWPAIKTIVVADAAMGIDNVLAVAGAAHGSFVLVVTGLLISIPIVVFGSTLVLKLLERFRWVLHIGVAVLGWTAAKMIVHEPLMAEFFRANAAASVAVYVAAIGGVFAAGAIASRRRELARSY
jgi:YjbE family integral membrane protein